MNGQRILVTVMAIGILACGLSAPASQVVTRAPSQPVTPPVTSTQTAVPPATGAGCLQSGDQNTINAELQAPGDEAVLCPGAVFELSAPVMLSADFQQIYTQGHPTDDRRATLRVAAPGLTTAVYMRDRNGVILSNLVIDGNRRTLGPQGGEALIYAGGYSEGQIIRDNQIMDTRSWSSLQLIEGHSESQPCEDAVVENNQIGPAGTSDNMQWADGISLACTNSVVRGNVITDATDGGIVVFGAPGSVIEGNTVRAETRTLLGGINMVDDAAYAGDYTGTVVRNNLIDAAGAVIRIGLGMGARVWTCLPSDAAGHTLKGGTVTGNTLRGEKMQYGFAVDGVSEWTVTGNVDAATHTGTPTVDCNGRVASRPAGFLYNAARAQGVFQPEFVQGQLDLALWAIVPPRPGE
jgi:parallel beta-helix repeat protein